MQVKTTTSKQVWQSPDGQMTIWEVTLQAENRAHGLKTYSPEIATVGYTGEVETYVNKRGDRFVKETV